MAQAKLFASIISKDLQAPISKLAIIDMYQHCPHEQDKHWVSALQSSNADVALIETINFDEKQLEIFLATDIASRVEIILISDGEPNPCIDIAMQNGISYHMRMPLDGEILNELLEDLYAEIQDRTLPTQKSISSRLSQYGLLIGSSRVMRQLYRVVRKSARTEASILIIGESGTGKELVANTLHLMSQRADKPFVSLNCAAISMELVESELFGHIKGAFTGATNTRAGVFEQAEGGTLFLDEITEMPIEQQVKLLRVLESGEYKPVGSEDTRVADVRIVAATNRDPVQAIEEGVLREDLYFRVAHFPISVPPLREREEDIEGLAVHFLAHRNAQENSTKEITQEALEHIAQYQWPGNVRELLHTIERAYILADDIIGIDHLILEDSPKQTATDLANDSLEEIEKKVILQTLSECAGNKTEIANKLGISVKTLYNKLKKYGDLEEA